MKKWLGRFGHWLYQKVQGRAYHHIYSGGDLYMERFWVVKESPLHRFSARLHKIVRSDADRHLHDHPFHYLTIILFGGYTEVTENEDGIRVSRWYGPGSVVVRRATSAHRLILPHNSYALTLFLMWKVDRQWGFWVNKRWVYWRHYLNDWQSAD